MIGVARQESAIKFRPCTGKPKTTVEGARELWAIKTHLYKK